MVLCDRGTGESLNCQRHGCGACPFTCCSHATRRSRFVTMNSFFSSSIPMWIDGTLPDALRRQITDAVGCAKARTTPHHRMLCGQLLHWALQTGHTYCPLKIPCKNLALLRNAARIRCTIRDARDTLRHPRRWSPRSRLCVPNTNSGQSRAVRQKD